MADVVVEGVRKSFGSVEVLKGVDVAVDDGEMLVILGPSGCGKSTLLRLIAGLETITAGEIRIGGRRVNDLEPMDRDIAMVFQNYALYPHMTVYDNMAYGLRNRRTPKPEIERLVREAAGILGLGELLARKPRQLSGGQRQRVAMGRAIVRDPEAFLFDEPLSNLDAKLRVQMRAEIKHLQRRLGTTGIYVTHDQVEAMTLGDRLMVMHEGEVEQIGRPLEIYAKPATLFVAGFIGSPAMNVLDGVIAENGRCVRLGETLLPLAAARPGEDGRPVRLGLRPEHLRPGDGDAGIALEVGWLEQLGADTIVYGHLAGTNGEDPASGAAGHIERADAVLDAAIGLAARVEGGQRVAPGDRLVFTVAPEHVHLFDPQTRRRLDDA